MSSSIIFVAAMSSVSAKARKAGRPDERSRAAAAVALASCLHVRRDHAGLDQRVEPGRAVHPEISQAHDGLHELLGPGLVQQVQ